LYNNLLNNITFKKSVIYLDKTADGGNAFESDENLTSRFFSLSFIFFGGWGGENHIFILFEFSHWIVKFKNNVLKFYSSFKLVPRSLYRQRTIFYLLRVSHLTRQNLSQRQSI
jgi:hypothetical protein